MTPEEWYSMRDDRTGRIAGRLPFETFHPLITIPSALEECDKIGVSVLLGILARFCRKITVQPSKPDPHEDWRTFMSQEIASMSKADPFGEFRMLIQPVTSWTSGPAIIFGAGASTATVGDIVVSPEGWGCRVTRGRVGIAEIRNHANVVGKVMAGCLAAREIFLRLVEERQQPHETFRFSPLGLNDTEEPPWPEQIDLGKCLAIGVGGVGSNLILLLRLANIRGSITMLDYDKVDFTNLNRCLPFYFEDAELERNKVDVVKERCESGVLQLNPFRGDYTSYVTLNGRGKFETYFALANDGNVLWNIENNLPPLTWYAAMSPNWGITVSRHVPMQEGCIACFDALHSSTAPTFVCSEGEIPVGGEPILGSLPFLAPLTATILLARAIAHASAAYIPRTNLLTVDTRSSHPKSFETTLPPSNGCACKTFDEELYTRLLRGTA